jgi:hypothetical protein
VPAAQAVNKAPNPGFEADCGGVPCFYAAVSPATIIRDTSVAHAGAASMRITVGAGRSGADAMSDCITGVGPGTTISAGFWFRPGDAAIVGAGLSMSFYSGFNCEDGTFIAGVGPAISTTPANVGQWVERVPTTFGAPPNTHSMKLNPNAGCTATCAGSTAYFDDLTVDFQPTAVVVASFGAASSGRGVVVRWRTVSHAASLGFNVYRQAGGERLKLNRRLIGAVAGSSAHSYSFVDGSAPRGRTLRYWLQEVGVDGSRRWHGSVLVTAR